jgi:hypothetical protein
MFHTNVLKELYFCYTKKDDLVLQRKTQMETYQRMIQKILSQQCSTNIVEFYKLYEKYNHDYNVVTLENPLKCEKLQEMIHDKNRIIHEIQKLNVCNREDMEQIRTILKSE